MRIGEIAALTGVTLKTLRHYDKIGLLKPDAHTEGGYRCYECASLERLQQILFFRELDFSLKEIASILDAPGYDKELALTRQRIMLQQKRDRIDRLLAVLDPSRKEDIVMRLNAFDQREGKKMKEQYAEEVKRRWGQTEAYRESEQKMVHDGDKRCLEREEEREALLAAFAEHRAQEPGDAVVQDLVRRWQKHISDHFYVCSKAILADLGEMYTADERFTQTIDQHGTGTAAFMSLAIFIYCNS